MILPQDLITNDASGPETSAPFHHVVITSRARYARNLVDHPFSPHATPPFLEKVREEVAEAFARSEALTACHYVDLMEATRHERAFLKECRLISKEMEKEGRPGRAVYLGTKFRSSIMVNEEDHLRIQCLRPGLQLSAVQEELTAIDDEVAKVIGYAFHDRFGYLTACPTNVGTALRASVMMHLPGITLRRETESAFQGIANLGLTVRGFHGENTENLGDFYQISNETTLGKSVEEIEQTLAEVVSGLIDRELRARSLLLAKGGMVVQDSIWRSYGILLHARRIETTEAMKLLSRIRLGVDEGYFPNLTHGSLNQLITEIQSGHLILRHHAPEDSEQRDEARAELIRKKLETLPA